VRTPFRLSPIVVTLALLATVPLLLPAPNTYAAGARPSAAANARRPATQAPRTITWDDLVPPEGRLESIFGEGGPPMSLSDDDPLAQEMMAKLEKMYRDAPVAKQLDNTLVRLAGFAIPLDVVDGKATSLLLVPYFGACIHEPPPPSNQIVYVTIPSGARIERAFDVVWVTGTLRTRGNATRYAQAGYTLEGRNVAPYRDEDNRIRIP
jgi:hypothetical protein